MVKVNSRAWQMLNHLFNASAVYIHVRWSCKEITYFKHYHIILQIDVL